MSRRRGLGALLLVAVTAGCGTTARGPTIERTFDVDWHDRASQVDVTYTARRILLHDGRWSAQVTVHNKSGSPLYEAVWAPPGDPGTTWNGPALVYSGLDVLGSRRLIFVPADTEQPRLPVPLANGATWHGTIGGKLPIKPALPHGTTIWLRYPMFGLGRPYDGYTTSLAVQWISDKGFQL